jgi:hypothetical protein
MHYSALLLLPALLFPAAQSDKTPQPVAMPADLVDDSYAIYSKMMGEGSPDGDRWVAISEITQESTSESFGPELCLSPPDSDRAAFDEVLKDFKRRHETVVKLEPRFHLSGNYRLITKKEVDMITGSRKWWGGDKPELPQEYAGVRGIIWLSQVYFDADRDMAIAYMGTGCGSLCGTGAWMAFKKIDGQWKGQPWGGALPYPDSACRPMPSFARSFQTNRKALQRMLQGFLPDARV